MDFSHGNLKRQGHAGLAGGQPDLPFARLQTALRLRPRRALSSAEAMAESMPARRHRNEIPPPVPIIPVLIAQPCPVLIAPRQQACKKRVAAIPKRFKN